MSQAEAENPTGWSSASSGSTPSTQLGTGTETQPFGYPVCPSKLSSKFSWDMHLNGDTIGYTRTLSTAISH